MDGKHQFTKKAASYVIPILKVTMAANIALFPIILYHFQNIPLISIISNLLVSPLFVLVLIGSFILVLVSLVFLIPTMIGSMFQKLVECFLIIPHFCASIPFGNIKMITFPWYITGLYYIVCLIISYHYLHKKAYPHIVNWISNKAKKILLVCCIVIISGQIVQMISREFTITMIDVGQGDSTLIQTRTGITMLIDGGGEKEGSDFKVGERVTLPYLLHKGILSLDYVMVTHFDSDHSAGLFTILENCKVKNVIIGKQGKMSNQYSEFYKLAKKKGCNIIEVEKGNVLKLDSETIIEIFMPDRELIQENILNNNSIVAKLVYKNFSMLFTGDIEEIAEKKLLRNFEKNDKLNATVLKVAHHGSKSSSITEFIDEVKPKIAVIGVGKDNSFGHPNQGVLERLQEKHIQVFRTDLHGEITLKIKKNGKIQVKTFIK